MLSRLVITFLPRNKRLLISWLQSPSAMILEPPKKACHCFLICLPWSDGTRCHDLSFLNVEFEPNFFTLLFHFQEAFQPHQEAFQFLFTFFHKGSVICISEVINISPGNLDSSLCFIQPSISPDVLCKLNKQGDNLQPWCTPFPIWNQSLFPCLVLTVASWPAYRFLRR